MVWWATNQEVDALANQALRETKHPEDDEWINAVSTRVSRIKRIAAALAEAPLSSREHVWKPPWAKTPRARRSNRGFCASHDWEWKKYSCSWGCTNCGTHSKDRQAKGANTGRALSTRTLCLKHMSHIGCNYPLLKDQDSQFSGAAAVAATPLAVW